MKSYKKKKLHGNFVEKEDLGQYSKTLGAKPLYSDLKKDLHTSLYQK
jgi:hypothetical protein